jgi:hypothetical protein
MYKIIISVCLMLFISCQGNEKSKPIAVAYGNKLYVEDLLPYFSVNLSKEDSLLLLKNLTNEWVLKQLKLNQAKSVGGINIDKLVEDYRQDLLVNTFINSYLAANLDTAVKEQELRQYFKENQQNFILSRNIIRLIFLRIDKEEKDLKKISKWVKSGSAEDIVKLSEICAAKADNYFLDYNVWLDFDDVLKELPIKTYDAEQFLRANRYLEIPDGKYVYLINIVDYKIKNSPSEFEFERENIKKVLLNSRKNVLLKKLEQELLEDAYKNQNIEIFIQH